MNKRIKTIINKDAYLKNWRQKTAICLLALGVSDNFIESALTGQMTRQHCRKYCAEAQVNFNDVWETIK